MSAASLRNLTENEIRHLAHLVNNRMLELIILPTERCNFRCTYCYETFALGKMNPETIGAVKKLMERRAEGLDVLSLSWFGGEPLLAKDVVMEISDYAAELAKGHPSLSYRAGMTTNGYLLDLPTFTALAKVGLLDYQISLDGPRAVHDRTRIKAGGGASFDTIWKNLVTIRTTDIPARITLRVHFSGDTLEQIEPLMDEIKCALLDDSRFTVFFKAISRLGGANDHNIQTLTPEGERAAIKRLKERLYGSDLASSDEEPHVCYASRPNSLVIRSDGRVGKCTVALEDSRNVIGALRPDGTLALNQERIGPWLRGLQTMDAAVLACPLSTLPTG